MPGFNPSEDYAKATPQPEAQSGFNPTEEETVPAVIDIAADIPQDKAAQIFKYAEKLGVPETFVDSNFDEVKKQVDKDDFDIAEFRAKSPLLAAWKANDPYKFSFSKPELGFFGGIEHSLRVAKDAYNRGANQQELGELYDTQRGKGYLGPIELKRLSDIENENLKADRRYGLGKLDYIANTVGQTFGQGAITALGTTAVRAGAAVGGGLLAGPAGAVVAERTAAVPLAAYTGYRSLKMNRGFAYKDLVDGGVDHATASDIAQGIGVINSVIEAGSDYVMGGILASGIKKITAQYGGKAMSVIVKEALMQPTKRAALIAASKKMAGAGASEGIEEFLQALVSGGGKSIAQDMSGVAANDPRRESVGQVLKQGAGEGIDAAIGSALSFGLISAGTNLHSDIASIRKAEADYQEAKGLEPQISESVVLGSNEKVGEELLGVTFQGSEKETTYIDTTKFEEYWSSKGLDPRAVAAEIMGDNGASFDEAKNESKYIEIPTSKYNMSIVRPGHGDFFRDHKKFSPEDLTKAEADELLKDVEKFLDESKKLTPEQIAEQSFIKDHVRDTVLKSGRFDALYADAVANLYDLRYSERAELLGVEKNDLYRKSLLSIENGPAIGKTTDERGALRYVNGLPKMTLGEDADLSTITHETGHLWLNEMMSDEAVVASVESKNFRQQAFLEDMQTVRGFFGKQNHASALKVIEKLHKTMTSKLNKDPANKDLQRFVSDTTGALEEIKNNGGEKFLAEKSATLFQGVDEKHKWVFITPYHEMFADGFNKYLIEGKAPDKSLRGLYSRFKSFLMQIYLNSKNIGVNLTDEMRGVFDRLITINQKREQDLPEFKPLIANPEKWGMTKTEAASYSNNTKAMREAEEAKAFELASEDMLKERAAMESDLYDKAFADAKAELKSDKRYVALNVFKHGEGPDGAPIPAQFKKLLGGLNKKEVTRLYGADTANSLPQYVFKSYAKKEDLETTSKTLGFAGSEDLINQIKGLEDVDAMADKIASERVRKEVGSILTDATLADKIMEMVHTRQRDQVLHDDMQAMYAKSPTKAASMIGKLLRRPPTPAELNKAVAEATQKKKLGAISSRKRAEYEKKYAKSKVAYFKRGDSAGVQQSLRDEAYSSAAYQEELAIEKRLTKFVEKARKINSLKTDETSKTRDMDTIYAIRAILSRVGLSNDRGTKSVADYLRKTKEYDPATYDRIVGFFEGTLNALPGEVGRFRDITVEQFDQLEAMVDGLYELSSTLKTINVGKEKVLKEQAIKEITGSLSDISKKVPVGKRVTAKDGFNRFAQKFTIGSIRMRSLADELDLGNINGPIHKYIFDPVQNAVVTFTRERNKKFKELAKILNKYTKTWEEREIIFKDGGTDEDGNAIDFVFTNTAHLISALRHIGNESNKRKLLLGYGWATETEVQAADGSTTTVFDSSKWDNFIIGLQQKGILKKEHYDYLQAEWDLNKSLLPAAQKAHKEMYGYHFNEIELSPVVTPWGNYAGGYVPAIVDKSLLVGDHKNQEELESLTNQYMFPTTGRGFTKGRNENYTEKLLLDMKQVPNHLDKVLRFTHIEPSVKNVAKLVKTKEVQASIDGVRPGSVEHVVLPWLRRAASQSTVSAPEQAIWKALEGVSKSLRSNASMRFLMGSFSNAFQQVTGGSVASARLGPKYVALGYAQAMTSPFETIKSISERSEMMAQRFEQENVQLNGEIKELIVNPTGYEKTKEFIQQNALILQNITQSFTDRSVWLAAYAKATDQKMSEADAVKFADNEVILTQGSNLASEISETEVGNNSYKLLTMFWGYFNMVANLNRGEFAKAMRTGGYGEAVPRLMFTYFWSVAMAAGLSDLIMQAMNGSLSDEDDDGILDELMFTMSTAQFKYAARLAPPGANIFTSLAVGHFTDVQYDDRISMSPVLSQIESGERALDNWEMYFKKDNPKYLKKAIGPTLDTATLFTGIPFSLAARPLNYLMETDVQPTNSVGDFLDFSRGLVTGKTGQEGKKK
jgi:hypothetical protein